MFAYLRSWELYKIIWTSDWCVNHYILCLFVFLRHPDHLLSFCLKCGIHKSITDSRQLSKLCDVLDEHLNNFLKKRISIKPDGYCLPRAVFNGIKRNGFLVGYSNYKLLLREAIFGITFNDLYLDWIADSKENII